MNIFVICTGRNGSSTLAKACSHIVNYSSGHETRCMAIGNERLDYPKNHIEIDNRLCFYLGSLDKKYGDNAFYVHLIRDEEKVIDSFNKRWADTNHSIIFAFAKTIKFLIPDALDETTKYEISKEYVQITKDNIEFFLKGKTNKIQIRLENFKEDFCEFWKWIGAEGNLELAIKELQKNHNASVDNEIEINKKMETKIVKKPSFILKLKHRLRIN